MPRAYIETILSSKPGNRRWYLAISCGSKVDRRSRGTSRSILPVSVTTVLRPYPLRLLPSSSPPRWWSISAFSARSASAFFSPSSRPFGPKAVFGSAPASSWSRIASGIRGSLRLGMSGLLRSYHARPHTKFPTGPALPPGRSGGHCGRRPRQAEPRGRSEPDRERRQEPERLADLPRQLQELALQRARPDQHREHQEPPGRLDALAGPRHPWAAVVPAGRRRRALLHRLLQPRVRARRGERRGDLVLHPEARRGPDRRADPHALHPRHRAGPRPRLRRLGRRTAVCPRHEDRQAGLGD